MLREQALLERGVLLQEVRLLWLRPRFVRHERPVAERRLLEQLRCQGRVRSIRGQSRTDLSAQRVGGPTPEETGADMEPVQLLQSVWLLRHGVGFLR